MSHEKQETDTVGHVPLAFAVFPDNARIDFMGAHAFAILIKQIRIQPICCIVVGATAETRHCQLYDSI